MGYIDLLPNLDRHIVLSRRTIGWMHKTPVLKNKHLIRKNLRVRAKQSKTGSAVEFPHRTTPRTRAAHEGIRLGASETGRIHLSHARAHEKTVLAFSLLKTIGPHGCHWEKLIPPAQLLAERMGRVTTCSADQLLRNTILCDNVLGTIIHCYERN